MLLCSISSRNQKRYRFRPLASSVAPPLRTAKSRRSRASVFRAISENVQAPTPGEQFHMTVSLICLAQNVEWHRFPVGMGEVMLVALVEQRLLLGHLRTESCRGPWRDMREQLLPSFRQGYMNTMFTVVCGAIEASLCFFPVGGDTPISNAKWPPAPFVIVRSTEWSLLYRARSVGVPCASSYFVL